jgi:hypothetical protein
MESSPHREKGTRLKFPVTRQAAETINEWAAPLAQRAGVALEEFLASPMQHMNYPISSVRVELMDGSQLDFRYAFALISEELRAIAVFSEHCGNLVLPYHEAKVYQAGELQFAQSAA